MLPLANQKLTATIVNGLRKVTELPSNDSNRIFCLESESFSGGYEMVPGRQVQW